MVGVFNELEHYERENLSQPEAELDLFTVERYRQFARHLPPGVRSVLDVGCSTGRGGLELVAACPGIELWGLDVVRTRLDALPAAYSRRLRGLSTNIPAEDGSLDVVVAGEFLEHLRAADVDPTLCEFQRVLRVGGRLLMTTPNPNYLRHRLSNMSVYGPGHLTQHHIRVLKLRLMWHGFRSVRVRGSGRMSRVLGEHIPLHTCYGSYFIQADKI